MASEEIGPLVGIIMGSDSDLSTMQHAGSALRDAGYKEVIDYEDRVISAHRTPDEMSEYAASAAPRKLKAVIAGAGGSAHLPGMVASETGLPVVGVAVTSKPHVMNRALGSMIGMPEGKPLATFQSDDGAYKAGAFVARILALAPEAKRIGVVMNSEDEKVTMDHVSLAFTMLGLIEGDDYEKVVLPTGKDVYTYAGEVAANNLAVLITAAAGEGEMPKDLARNTNLPVLGVAITDNPDVSGPDLGWILNSSLEEPIAAFQAKTGAFNAGLFTARILALQNEELGELNHDYVEGLRWTVKAKDAVLQRLGAQAYMALEKADLNNLLQAELELIVDGEK